MFTGDHYETEIKKVSNYSREKLDENEMIAICREIKDVFDEYSRVVPRMPNEIYNQVVSSNDPKVYLRRLLLNITLPFDDKQSLIEAATAGEKLAILLHNSIEGN